MRRILLAAWAALALGSVVCAAYATGHRDGRRTGAAAELNGYLAAGFTLTDPEGFEVERFE
jgi:hypothetical protein